MPTEAEVEQRRKAGAGSWHGHRERQLRALGIDPEELDRAGARADD